MDTTKKRLGNINILDVRNTAQEVMDNIESIGNVNIILHSRETANLFGQINMGNVNNTIETDIKSSMFLCVMGQLVIEPDVPVKDIQDKLSGLILMGQLLCPENLVGLVDAKSLLMMAQKSSYQPIGHTVIGQLNLVRRDHCI